MNPSVATPQIEAPEPVFNCPQCSHWLPAGTIACPDCQHIIYSDHLRRIALAANEQERSQQWAAARELWQTALPWLPPGTQTDSVHAKVQQLTARIQSGEDRKARWTKRLGPLAPAAFFLLKAKSLLFLVFKLKFLLSFVVFFGLYWALFGWKFGLGFTLSILIHEMGHYVAARRRGLKTDLPVFLPGLGAYVRWYAQGTTLETLAAIALAGPTYGFIAALACGVIAIATHSALFAALAHTGAWLNLLNLIPVLGLDGAQATYALNRLQRGLILVTSLIFLAISHEWVFLFIALGMGWRTFTGPEQEKPSTPTMIRYVLLLFLLGVVIYVFPDTGRRF
ncbi:site-2 protease family protein [Granulicella sp. WH15]|uniref:site-2 protease family protein n=1 Tax=Granulicella sp. WH15 TaxID=2602070 RepID=UPI0013670990|nr:site-2 protease family protein [Granulicella sp. WH15]QHN02148.1 site-2 protease family protein [Granulicella sp. WH15]